jgi:murein L,D-transpeptidase YafK
MRSRIARVLMLGLVVMALVMTALWDRVRLVLDERRAAGIKAQRLIQFGLGLPLPGTPDTDRLDARLKEQGFALGAPVFMRIFKAESELEIWLRRGERYERFTAYPICRWSGQLGPKLAQGDRQAPEGFYSVAADQLNPNSRWHRSFNIGFPNALDRSYSRTGTFLMVHGGCSSVGCYAMTDPVIDEIWRLVTAALRHGQPHFHVHIFPFRMTAANLARRKNSPWLPFWQDLKHGHDLFETQRVPPKVLSCNGHYAFERAPAGIVDAAPLGVGCPTPAIEQAVPGASPAETAQAASKARTQR